METTAGVMGAKRGQWRAIKDLSRAALDGSKWLWSQMTQLGRSGELLS